MTGSGRPVVVAVPVADPAGAVLEWAAAEAAARGAPLRIVHVLAPQIAVDPYGLCASVPDLATPRAVACLALEEAAGRASALAGDLDVRTWLGVGRTVPTLAAQSAGAALLVLGRRGRRLTPVAGRLLRRTGCPVVVVPGDGMSGPTRSRPRVVLAVDVARCSPAATGTAFRAAAQRGVPLVAVHAWTGDTAADLEGVHDPSGAAEEVARVRLAAWLAPWRDRFPEVPVETRLVRDDPGCAVVAASEGAALVVVGASSRGPVLGAVLGSVCRTGLQRVPAPLAVVPSGDPRVGAAGSPRTLHRRPPTDAGRAGGPPDRSAEWE